MNLIYNEPPTGSEDTQRVFVPQLQAHNAVPVVVMVTPEGVIAGEVMVNSFAYRKLIEGGYYELRGQS